MATLLIAIVLFFGVILGLRSSSLRALQIFYLSSAIPPILLALVFVLDKLHSSVSLLIPLGFSLLLSILGLAIGFGSIVIHLSTRKRVGKLVVSTLLAAMPIFYAFAKTLLH